MDALSSLGTHFTATAVTQGMAQADAKPMSTRDARMIISAQLLLPLLLGLLTPRPAAAASAVAADHMARPHSRTL